MLELQPVVVRDVRIPFLSMVILMVKWALAAIPALFLLVLFGTAASGFVAGLFLRMLPTSTGIVSPLPQRSVVDQASCERDCDSVGRSADCYAACERLYGHKP